MAELTSWITIFTSNNKYLNDLVKEYQELDEQEAMTNPHGDEPWPMIIKDMSNNKIKQDYLVGELKGISRQRIIEKIHLIRLRLNPKDDVEAIGLLNNLLEYFISPEFDNKNYDLINDGLKKFVTLSQNILKNEWDKVKRETKKGR